MTTFFLLFSLFVLSIIAYQDFRFREVVWIIFPMLFISGLLLSIANSNSWVSIIKNTAVNSLLTGFQFCLIRLYFKIKNKNDSFINVKIGTGDILFIFSSTSFFSSPIFVFFYTGSLVFSLFVYIIGSKIIIRNIYSKTIPLAGLQSVFMSILLLTGTLIVQPIFNKSLYL